MIACVYVRNRVYSIMVNSQDNGPMGVQGKMKYKVGNLSTLSENSGLTSCKRNCTY